MRQILLLLSFFATLSAAHALDPLEGAFGLRFGDVFTPSEQNVSDIVRTDDQIRTRAYKFLPAVANHSFTEYWVYITPVTHRIYRIVAVGRAKSPEQATSQQDAVITVARTKYDGDFLNRERWVVQGSKSVTVRPPTALPDGSFLWQVAYTDMSLMGKIIEATNGTLDEIDETGL